ncbi:malectin-A [Malaya genurostris]|uniref:malectin-A n=1 Tax=Malaya genurostris TaxID=325434 RepID=UPI0026F38CCE|nr:malectin-A [Malaya genurostris]XP_058453738.1 malectin-A [Malaya genurostris]
MLPLYHTLCILGSIAYISTLVCAVQQNVIFAINAGGDAHVDSNGIKYARDPLMGKVGTESDYGKQLLMINRVKPNDELLYQTERYHHDTFGYDLPVAGDGEYVLILKFCEVYFNAPNMKVFDVLLNNRHMVVSDLDIFSLVGKGTAHDEYVYFTVSRGRLYFKEEDSEIRGGKVKLEFLKGYKDNPKINAIVLIKGYDETTIPKLTPVASEQTVQEQHVDPPIGDVFVDGDAQTDGKAKQRKTSGPKQPNPYSLDESSMMLPVFIAIGAFIPLLFCLCRL